MNRRLLFDAAFDSLWNWLLGGITLIISVITFFYPDLQPILNFPTLSEILPPFGWLATGIIIWLVGFVWNVRKRRKEEPNKLKSINKIKTTSLGQSGGITADTVNIYGSDKKTALQNGEKHPIIIPDQDGFDKLERAFPLWNGNIPSKNRVMRYFLVLRNVGKVDTTPVYATVSFYRMNCNELKALSHAKAFWFNDKPRVQRSGSEVHIIRALSNPEGVCLVIRIEGNKDLYAFSDDSYFPGTGNIVFDKSLKIPTNKVYARVTVNRPKFNHESYLDKNYKSRKRQAT